MDQSSTGRSEIIARQVSEFYEATPFPGFDLDKYESCEDLARQAHWFARLLDAHIPLNAEVLDAGCGTGQLTCFLARRGRRVLGIDTSERSLAIANALKEKLGVGEATFRAGDVLALDLAPGRFDVVLCLGVLHHTTDPARGIENLVRVTRCGGHLVAGLYNRYGRLVLHARRWAYRLFGNPSEPARVVTVSRQWGMPDGDSPKAQSWYQDQYEHPYESTHTIGQALRWFRQAGVAYINSVPPIELLRHYSPTLRLFQRQVQPSIDYTGLCYLLVQLGWILSLRNTGGYFVLVGQREGKTP
jgi:2-polyprenyl-3-methyl-5-hydroxy-6-metoxy-1,4-benzoquinol methylase